MSSPQTPQSVIIVGGSLAGQMAALTLLSKNHPAPTVQILERSPTALLHDQGAGIVAQAETQEFFSKLVKPNRDLVVSSKTRHYLNSAGEVIPEAVEHRTQRMTSWDLLYHLLRWRVSGLQSPYVTGLEADDRPKARYQNGCTVTSIQDLGGDAGLKVSWTQAGTAGATEETASADLVIAADGASSTIRSLLDPEADERKYAGYVAWRGTVPESELSEAAKAAFVDKFTFYHATGMQILGYLIPGPKGTLEPGSRLFNWVWYVNYAEGGPELEELMTDVDGRQHRITLPVGKMRPDVWEKQKRFAADVLPFQFAETVEKTEQPFVQAITDVIASRCSFLDRKVLLLGDALAGFRPHTAASTSQAAFDALRLGEYMEGTIGREEYEEKVMEFAKNGHRKGIELGERSQFGRHPFAS